MSNDLGSIVHATNCVNLVHNLEIGTQFPDSENAQHNLEIGMQFPDSENAQHNLEIGMQFPDSENAQHNLAIAQIPRLRGTSACTEV